MQYYAVFTHDVHIIECCGSGEIIGITIISLTCSD